MTTLGTASLVHFSCAASANGDIRVLHRPPVSNEGPFARSYSIDQSCRTKSSSPPTFSSLQLKNLCTEMVLNCSTLPLRFLTHCVYSNICGVSEFTRIYISQLAVPYHVSRIFEICVKYKENYLYQWISTSQRVVVLIAIVWQPLWPNVPMECNGWGSVYIIHTICWTYRILINQMKSILRLWWQKLWLSISMNNYLQSLRNSGRWRFKSLTSWRKPFSLVVSSIFLPLV